jgi:ABC-type glycerol-3-phosphate transport system substrate-binding protein
MKKQTRRQFMKTAAATGLAIAGAPYVQTSHSAGQLKLLFWSHWVPGAHPVMEKIVNDWAKKNRLDLKLDAVTGARLAPIAAGVARAGTGQDMMAHNTWGASIYQDKVIPLDDVVADITKASGPFLPGAEYVCKIEGKWLGMPSPIGSHTYPMVSRVDYFKKFAGVDLKKIFPASPKRNKKLTDAWTWKNFEKYAQKIHGGGHPFGAPITQQSDSGNWLASLFRSFGSVLVDAKGNITVNSDGTREVLEYLKRLTQWMPPDVYAWDNAGNNRWLISGKGGAIVNPPSAWAVAKRIWLKDKSKDGVTHVWHADIPRGPKGHFRSMLPFHYTVWKFSKQQNACKDLLRHMLSREVNFKLITAGQGYYNYPVRGSEELFVTGYPAPPAIGAPIFVQGVYAVMTAKACQAKQPINEVIKWAENELEGFQRG